MKNNGVLVTKEFHDSMELKLNDKISDLIVNRDLLIKEYDNNTLSLDDNRKAYKLQRKEYKKTIKLAKKELKREIKLAKKKYYDAEQAAYVPLQEAEDSYNVSKVTKKQVSRKLNRIRSEISKLKRMKLVIEKKYVSEKDEYIDISKYSKVYKKIDSK